MLKLTNPDAVPSEAYERKERLGLARPSCGIGLKEMELGLEGMSAPREKTSWVSSCLKQEYCGKHLQMSLTPGVVMGLREGLHMGLR